ncbi:MAG: sigma-70 family RNA polymerase sigma factor [Planctomycetes bacterium]|nr:sigma-70 family RNA polymerase sigma factor [Planctomycetota bacterium]
MSQSSVSYSDEARLLEGLRAGDDAAYDHMIRQHGGRLLAVIQRIVHNADDAADVLQDTFVAAFRNIDGFAGQSKLSTWLHQIAVNNALMKLRKKRNIHERSIEDLLPKFQDNGHRIDVGPTWDITAEDVVQKDELMRQVHEQIANLPEQYREVLLMRDIEEVSTEEAAGRLGITTGALKVRLHRARQALRTLLEENVLGGMA